MKIWLVSGQTGEYSDRGEWVVKAFDDELTALNFAEDCEKAIRDAFAEFGGEEGSVGPRVGGQRYSAPKGFKHPLDPQWTQDYTGTAYFHHGPYELKTGMS